MVVRKDMLVGDLIRTDIRYAQIMMMHGLSCLGCPASQVESVEQAAKVHGIDLDALLEDLNSLEEDEA